MMEIKIYETAAAAAAAEKGYRNVRVLFYFVVFLCVPFFLTTAAKVFPCC